jgi:hypothetical protein
MKKLRMLMPIGILVAVAGFSAIVMLLWNWLVPTIFGLTEISFWQALGLLALSHILFSGGRKMPIKHGGGFGHNPLREKWAKMTLEERKEFINKRNNFVHNCGGFHKHPFFDNFEMEKKGDEPFNADPANEPNKDGE